MQILVFAPGITGSSLTLNGKRVWPPTLEAILNGSTYIVNQIIDPKVQAGQVISSIDVCGGVAVPIYQGLFDLLKSCGFSPSGGGDKLLVPFPYDWRKDNAASAALLDQTLTTLVQTHNAPEIILLGHSMGGLVIRYAVESGKYTGSPWFRYVRSLITLATPHLGAPAALNAAMGLESYGVLGFTILSGADLKRFADDPRYPAVYQLLPPPGTPATWQQPASASGSPLSPINIYDPATARALGLAADNLGASRAFWGKLSFNPQSTGNIRYFFFASTAETTEVRNDWNGSTLTSIRANFGGDGTVPIWSSTLPQVQTEYAGGNHIGMTTDPAVRAMLPVLLGSAPAQPALAAGPRLALAVQPLAAEVPVRLSTPALIVRQNTPIPVSIAAAAPAATVAGTLTIEKLSSGKEPQPVGQPVTVADPGPAVNRQTLVLPPVAEPGAYRIRLVQPGGNSAETPLVVAPA